MANKKDLVSAVSDKLGTTKKYSEEVLETVIDVFVEAIVNDGEVNVTGLGKFDVVEVPARERRNPSTGEVFMGTEHGKVRFKPCASLKEAVR